MFTHWTTIDGEVVTRDTITHGHLSNIHYYTNYIYPSAYPQSVRDDIMELINARFNGEILPYVPKYDWEISYLKQRGWLRRNGNIVFSQGMTHAHLGNLNIN